MSAGKDNGKNGVQSGLLGNLPVILAASTAIVAGLYGYANGYPNSRVYQNMCLFLIVFYLIGAFLRQTIGSLTEELNAKKYAAADAKDLLAAGNSESIAAGNSESIAAGNSDSVAAGSATRAAAGAKYTAGADYAAAGYGERHGGAGIGAADGAGEFDAADGAGAYETADAGDEAYMAGIDNADAVEENERRAAEIRGA